LITAFNVAALATEDKIAQVSTAGCGFIRRVVTHDAFKDFDAFLSN